MDSKFDQLNPVMLNSFQHPSCRKNGSLCHNGRSDNATNFRLNKREHRAEILNHLSLLRFPELVEGLSFSWCRHARPQEERQSLTFGPLRDDKLRIDGLVRISGSML
jgi:hypothetical protein